MDNESEGRGDVRERERRIRPCSWLAYVSEGGTEEEGGREEGRRRGQGNGAGERGEERGGRSWGEREGERDGGGE